VKSHTRRRRKYSSERAENELRIATFFAAKKEEEKTNPSKGRRCGACSKEKSRRAGGKKDGERRCRLKEDADCKYVTVDPCNYTAVPRFSSLFAHALDL